MNAQDLKNSILQLAIQGKLAEQRKEEGTAKELLEQIKTEKEHLIKEKKIKKEKPLPAITEDEIPFDIPESWEWVKLGEIISVYGGKRIPAGRTLTEEDTGHKYIRVADMKNGSVNKDGIRFIPEDIFQKIKAYTISKNDIYITVAGTIGQVGLIPEELDNANLTENANKLVMINSHKEFIYNLLGSPYIQNQIRAFTTKVGQPKLAIMRIQNLILPMPPIEEQKRIVAKIEELMPFIDKYGESYLKLETLNKKFPEDMQKSILQYAIQGKLVEQRAEEGTAEELYQQIQAEKVRSVKEGKIKKDKPLPEITEDEIPFEIPESWKWVRLGDVLDIARGGSPRPIQAFITDSEDGVNWIKIGDTDKGGKYINSTNEKIIKEGMKKSRFVKKGDFLLSNSMSFGRPYILNINGCIHDGWLVLSQIVEVFNKDFLYYLLSSRMVFNQFQSIVSGAVVNNLNSDKVRLTIVPIPPIDEQKRIAAKIEELLPYCKQLIK